MHSCKVCGKEYKVERYLVQHEKKCALDTLDKQEDVKPLTYVSEEPVEEVPINSASIEKLKAQILRCKDAVTKNRYECELKRLS